MNCSACINARRGDRARHSPRLYAKMAEPRKASNHCEVADRVSCSDVKYFSRSEYIAAIDFGTTNCSLAYILSGKMSENGPKLLQFDGTVYRVMSASLFNPEGSMIALGETARTAYKNVGDEERLKHAYFEQIKMDLQHEDVRILLFYVTQ